jgi:hypothetical protein
MNTMQRVEQMVCIWLVLLFSLSLGSLSSAEFPAKCYHARPQQFCTVDCVMHMTSTLKHNLYSFQM